jgi:hypothetical protein
MQFYDGFLGHELAPLFNSRGHRCKELEDINLHKYILFAGDNVGVGWDKPIEETYPHIISKSLNMDYYNLCIYNGGLDALKHNLITWFSKVPEAPKAIIVSCEFLNSFLVCSDNYDNLRACDPADEYVAIVLDSGNTTGFWNARHAMMDRLIHSYTTTQIYQIIFEGKTSAFADNTVNILHEGDVFNHTKIAESFIVEMKERMTRIIP